MRRDIEYKVRSHVYTRALKARNARADVISEVSERLGVRNEIWDREWDKVWEALDAERH